MSDKGYYVNCGRGAGNQGANRRGAVRRLVGTAGLGLAVHVLLCLGSVMLGFTPLVRFVLPPPGGGHDYGALFEPLVSTMVWPYYMWLLLVPLSVAMTAVLHTKFWARRSWSGPAVNLVLAATLGLLLPIWLVTGGYAKGVNARDERGLTALMAAAGTGHLRGVRGLIGAGADVTREAGRMGRTPAPPLCNWPLVIPRLSWLFSKAVPAQTAMSCYGLSMRKRTPS